MGEPLLEREREVEEVRRVLGEAHEGRGRIVLIEGVAGVGKTTLLRVALEAAEEGGFACLRARAVRRFRAVRARRSASPGSTALATHQPCA